VRCARRRLGAPFLDVEFAQPVAGETDPDDRVVVAAIERQQLDVVEQSVGGDSVEGGFEEADVVAVRAVDGDSDRDAVRVCSDGPLVAEFGPVNRALPVPSPPHGALWMDPSIATKLRSSPMMRS
jgi:hypothetical protein